MCTRVGYCVLVTWLAACSSNPPGTSLGGVVGESVPTATPVPTNAGLLTIVDRPDVRIGDQVGIRCLEQQGTTLSKPAFVTTIAITPEPSDLQLTNAGNSQSAIFSTSESGTYRLYCRAADGSSVDTLGSKVVVRGNQPLSWTVSVPNQPCVSGSDRLEIPYEIKDKFGNIIRDAIVEAEVTPRTGVVGDIAVGLRFKQSGEYKVVVRVVSQLAQGSTIAPVEFNVTVDADPPVFEILSPARNAILTEGSFEDSPVQIKGRVFDTESAIQALTINGTDIEVNGDTFEVPIDVMQSSRWGITVATGHVEDSCGNVGYMALPYMRSPEMYPASTTANPESRVKSAFYGQVTQSFIDDGDRSDVDDIATLVERVAQNVDMQAYIPPGQLLVFKDIPQQCGSLFDTSTKVGFYVWRDERPSETFDFDGPYIENIDFRDSALGFGVGMGRTAISLRIRVNVLQCAGGAPDWDEVNLRVRIATNSMTTVGTFGMDLAGGEASASVENFSFVINGLNVRLECGGLQWACDAITGPLSSGVEKVLEKTIDDVVVQKVPTLLEDTLESFSIAPAITLGAPANMTLNVGVTLDQLTFCGPSVGLGRPGLCTATNSSVGSMGLGLGVQFYPSARGEDIPYNAPGPIKGPSGTGPVFDASKTSFGVAMNFDTINQLFWAMWYGGGLTVNDVPGALGDKVPAEYAGAMELALRPTMAPVLMPGKDGNVMTAGVGGLEIEGKINIGVLLAETPETAVDSWIDFELTGSMLLGFAVDFNNDRIKLSAQEEPQFLFEVTRINDVGYSQFAGEAAGKLVSTLVADALSSATAEVPLPAFDLGNVAGIEETRWKLSNARLYSSPSHMLFEGTIDQVASTNGVTQ